MCTGMMALVRAVTAASMSDGSMLKNRGSISTSTGRASKYLITSAVAANVYGVVITSSPCFNPMASRARCMAAVHELTAMACFAPTTAANADSNCFVFGPVVTQPEFSASRISASSDSSRSGSAKGRKFSLIVSQVMCGEKD